MKQGQASGSRMGGMKREPVSYAVSPGAVDRMGQAGPSATTKELYIGKGYQAPKANETCYPCGSQGRTK